MSLPGVELPGATAVSIGPSSGANDVAAPGLLLASVFSVFSPALLVVLFAADSEGGIVFLSGVDIPSHSQICQGRCYENKSGT